MSPPGFPENEVNEIKSQFSTTKIFSLNCKKAFAFGQHCTRVLQRHYELSSNVVHLDKGHFSSLMSPPGFPENEVNEK